jgi:putative copper export protein
MTLLAITNRYWLVPRLKDNAVVLDQIRRICIAVFCLGLCAIAFVGIFGTLAPT